MSESKPQANIAITLAGEASATLTKAADRVEIPKTEEAEDK
jgi:hypothetical protein